MFARKCKPYIDEAAAPEFIGYATGYVSSADTSHVISIPEGETGDLIIVIFAADGARTFTASNYTLVDKTDYSIAYSCAVYTRVATGSDSLTIATSGSETSCHVTLRVRNLSGEYTATVAKVTTDGATGITDLDPPEVETAGVNTAFFIAYIVNAVQKSSATFDDTEWTEVVRISSIDGTDSNNDSNNNVQVALAVAYLIDKTESADCVGWTSPVSWYAMRFCIAFED
jgi:flavin-binding protein dodecin